MILWGFPPPSSAPVLLYDAPVAMALADELTRDEGCDDAKCLVCSFSFLQFLLARHSRHYAQTGHYGLQVAGVRVCQRRSQGEPKTTFVFCSFFSRETQSLRVLLDALVSPDAGKSLDPLLMFSRVLLALPHRLQEWFVCVLFCSDSVFFVLFSEFGADASLRCSAYARLCVLPRAKILSCSLPESAIFSMGSESM